MSDELLDFATQQPGPANLITDLDGILVGNAHVPISFSIVGFYFYRSLIGIYRRINVAMRLQCIPYVI